MKRTFMITVLVLTAILVSGCGQKDTENSTHLAKTEATTEKTTEAAIPFTETTQVEYMILAEMFKHCNEANYAEFPSGPEAPQEVISGFEMYDADADGENELLIVSARTNTDGPNATEVIFDANDGVCSIWSDRSAAGDSKIRIDEENHHAYLEKIYATMYAYTGYNTWSKDGWSANTVYEMQDGVAQTCIWDGKEITEDEWMANEKALNLRDIQNQLAEMLSVSTNASGETVANTLTEALQQRSQAVYPLNTEDGKYYLVINDYCPAMWINRVNQDMTLGDEMFCFSEESKRDLVLFVEPAETGTTISCRMLPEQYDMTEVVYEDGIVIKTAEGAYTYKVTPEQELEKSGEPAAENAAESTTDGEENTESAATTTSAGAMTGQTWKDAYIAKIEEIQAMDDKDTVSGWLADLDQDGIPEMLAGTYFTGQDIYTYADGQVVSMGYHMYFGPTYLRGNKLISYECGQGFGCGMRIYIGQKVGNYLDGIKYSFYWDEAMNPTVTLDQNGTETPADYTTICSELAEQGIYVTYEIEEGMSWLSFSPGIEGAAMGGYSDLDSFRTAIQGW